MSSGHCSEWRSDSKVPILNWYYLTAYEGQKLFYNLSPQERAHDPTFLKAWAAGIDKVLVDPPRSFRSYFVKYRGAHVLTCVPSLGVLRWLASIASKQPNSITSIWGVRFKTVCKFNPYGLSLFAVGGDACFPYKIGKADTRTRGLEPDLEDEYDSLSNEDLADATSSDEDNPRRDEYFWLNQ